MVRRDQMIYCHFFWTNSLYKITSTLKILYYYATQIKNNRKERNKTKKNQKLNKMTKK
jgi:hypothetical protein